jgi:hypothetical protein
MGVGVQKSCMPIAPMPAAKPHVTLTPDECEAVRTCFGRYLTDPQRMATVLGRIEDFLSLHAIAVAAGHNAPPQATAAMKAEARALARAFDAAADLLAEGIQGLGPDTATLMTAERHWRFPDSPPEEFFQVDWAPQLMTEELLTTLPFRLRSFAVRARWVLHELETEKRPPGPHRRQADERLAERLRKLWVTFTRRRLPTGGRNPERDSPWHRLVETVFGIAGAESGSARKARRVAESPRRRKKPITNR